MNVKAFTLIELLMTSVIIIMSALIIGPRFDTFLHAFDLKTEVEILKADIRELQQAAITEDDTLSMTFDTSADSYTMEGYPGREMKDGVDLVSTTFTSAAFDTVDFDPLGAPSEPGNIIIKDNHGRTATVSIASITGKVKIEYE